MPKRTDIKSVLVLGAGPVIIGQACEFDYSGTQACKALKEEGYRVILVNSNPATIMTDPEMSDATYIEPLTPSMISMIIRQKAPDALLASVGGQTALNNAIQLHKQGILDKYGVELIGTSAESIRKAEDREVFAEIVRSLDLRCPMHRIVNDLSLASEVLEQIGLPAIVRPSYTLGGFGGGIAETKESFFKLIEEGLRSSPFSQVQVDESLIGWKEFELEMVRDKKDNCIVVCGIENVDALGVHTGDSITVAPILTLRDKEFQKMRDLAIKIMRAIGIDTGGANVQFAMKDDEVVVIEMNPRVSRSSALASKATGFPIAKVAAKLAVGYTLDEISNDCIPSLSASFEPSIDYVVTKIPRFDFEKFGNSNPVLNTQMQSVGEVMSLGRCFAESLQKALISLFDGSTGLEPIMPNSVDSTAMARAMLAINHPKKLLIVADAIRAGIDIDEICFLSRYDRWFVTQIQQIIVMETALSSAPSLSPELMLDAKKLGLSDARIASLSYKNEKEIRKMRLSQNIMPVFKRVDSCAGEFSCSTQYLYSCYEGSPNQRAECESRPSLRNKVIVIGSGPNQIGQGIEFDYACVHALNAIRANGFESIMINCNPETVSTDYDTSDKLYFSPLNEESIMDIIECESSAGNLLGVVVQLGGQTPIRLAKCIADHNIKLLGTGYSAIDITEDRKKFKHLAQKLSLNQPRNTTCEGVSGMIEACDSIGFPVVVRPSYVLGGRAMQVIHDNEELDHYIKTKSVFLEKNTILIDHFLSGAKEVDVDALCDGEDVYIAGILEHIELAGVHSGDSACSLPPRSLSNTLIQEIEKQTKMVAIHLGVIGLLNIQYAIKDEELYVIEVNLRASRTVPFISKATGHKIAYIATELMLQTRSLKDYVLRDWKAVTANHWAVKESVFPFNRFPNTDVLLGPEMQSTGEVMGIDINFPRAFAKAQIAGGNPIPSSGVVLISVSNQDKNEKTLEIAGIFAKLKFSIMATPGTAEFLSKGGIDGVASVAKVGSGKPDVVDHLRSDKITMVINTTSHNIKSIKDSKQIRLTSLTMRIPYCTTIDAAYAISMAVSEQCTLSVKPLQEYY